MSELTTSALTARKERWPELKEILADVLELAPEGERNAFLERACKGDADLLREARRLLSRSTDDFEAFAELGAPVLHAETESLVGQRLGAYCVIRELGRGGMGAVYLAERADGQFAKSVAIKVLKRGPDSEEILRRFRIEREILARLEHPNITHLLDAGTTDDGLPYFIMEFVDGAPITTFAEQHSLSDEARIALFLKICRAVDFAHRHGVVHRDIKPSNLLIGSDNEPKLLDFGIARMVQKADEEITLTLPLHQRLTPKYASPEQRAGNPADASSDIYSLGAVLLELLTDVSAGAATATRTHLRSDLGRVVSRAMAADPACRYGSAADFARDLELCLHRPNEIFRWWRSRKFRAVGVGVLGAIAVLLFLKFLPSRNQHSPAPESVAVLPFRVLGSDQSDASLGLGMADAVINRLSGIKQLRVLPTTSVSAYKGNAGDAIGAGRAFHVDEVLSGTVQRAGEKIRVTVQLVEVKSQRTLWADTFDQTFTTIFEIQDAISENVARSFSGRLTAAEQKQIEKRATTNAEAYDAFTMGLYFWSKRSSAGLDKAIEYLNRATSSDPQFARAYALMADCYYLKAFLNYSPAKEAVEKSRIAAEHAIALDPSVAEAHLAISTIQFWDGQPEAAVRSLREALALNPNLAIAHQRYAWALCTLEKLDEAVVEMRRAVELDPLSPTNNAALGAVFIFKRQYPSALDYCLRAVELEPANPATLLNLGWAYHVTGRYDEAIGVYEKLAALDASREGDAIALKAAVLYSAGRAREADALMPRVLEFAAEKKIDSYSLTLLYVMRGEFDSALESIRTTPPGERSETMLKFDPLLDTLRQDHRFAELISRRETPSSLNE